MIEDELEFSHLDNLIGEESGVTKK